MPSALRPVGVDALIDPMPCRVAQGVDSTLAASVIADRSPQ